MLKEACPRGNDGNERCEVQVRQERAAKVNIETSDPRCLLTPLPLSSITDKVVLHQLCHKTFPTQINVMPLWSISKWLTLEVVTVLLTAPDETKISLLSFLGVLAAIETSHHCMALSRLQRSVVNSGRVRPWFCSYFTDGIQTVCVNRSLPPISDTECCLTQD